MLKPHKRREDIKPQYVNGALLLVRLTMQVAWSMGTYTNPMAWFKLHGGLDYCFDAL